MSGYYGQVSVMSDKCIGGGHGHGHGSLVFGDIENWILEVDSAFQTGPFSERF